MGLLEGIGGGSVLLFEQFITCNNFLQCLRFCPGLFQEPHRLRAVNSAEQSEDTGDLAPLQAAVDANPADHQARFDLAVALNAAGQREGAVDHLLEIISRDRAWNDEAARKQLLQLFEAFGPTDPLTVDSRRRLSSILFS